MEFRDAVRELQAIAAPDHQRHVGGVARRRFWHGSSI